MEALKIEINNGRWHVNQKPLKSCSFEKKKIFDVYIRMKKLKSPIEQKSGPTFKQRTQEVKRLFNHKFANLQDDIFQNYPDITKLIFKRKN